MSISEWYDSEPMRQARLAMFNQQKNKFCSRCYLEEQYVNTSRRHRSLQKSVIFVRDNFDESYLQSPGYNKFSRSSISGAYSELPIDLHIDLGNYCNLTCKMCNAQSSSSIAVQEVKWGRLDAQQYVGTNWTRDDQVWNRTINDIATIDKLANIHFMGGETLITSRFEDFVDRMIELNRTNIGLSFVTNGTVFNQRLLDKLSKFKRVGIEISIESLTEHNSYQRQGTNTAQVLENIQRYLDFCNNTDISVTVRPAISALTVGTYYTLLEYCLKNKLLVKSLIVGTPAFLNPTVLPYAVRQQYLSNYQKLDQELDVTNSRDYNESDPNSYVKVIKDQVTRVINLLNSSVPFDQVKFKQLVDHCQRWDQGHGYNAVDLYPELAEYLVDHGY